MSWKPMFNLFCLVFGSFRQQVKSSFFFFILKEMQVPDNILTTNSKVTKDLTGKNLKGWNFHNNPTIQ